MDAVERQVAELTRAVRQLGLKLNRAVGGAGAGPGPAHARAATTDEVATRDALLDVLDALLFAEVARRHSLGGRVRRRLGREDQTERGLRIARELAEERLAALGLAPVRGEGVVDPVVHRVVHTRSTRDPARHATIAELHRRGWIREATPGAPVRVAHVTAWVDEDRAGAGPPAVVACEEQAR